MTKNQEKYNHYFKDVTGLKWLDIYRVCDLWEIKRSAVAHAIKKLLCAGNRGAKDYLKDLEEARDSINREIQMVQEDIERGAASLNADKSIEDGFTQSSNARGSVIER